jgi:excisionase family DNA binding protein
MDLMTVEEVAARLKLKRSWVYTHADELGVFRCGKYLRFSWPRVLEFLERKSGSLGPSKSDQVQTTSS